MRDVLVVLFWLWVLVAVGVYGYRLWRRATKGSKAQRAAAAPADEQGSPSAGRTLLSRSTPPPLPEGPVEARLPRSLQDQTPPPTASEGHAGEVAAPLSPEPPLPMPPTLTVAQAVEGIRMPEHLLPVIDAANPDLDRVARFAGTGTTVETVTTELALELQRLGFRVDGLETATPARAGLSATRDDATLAATVAYDNDTTAVVVELSV